MMYIDRYSQLASAAAPASVPYGGDDGERRQHGDQRAGREPERDELLAEEAARLLLVDDDVQAADQRIERTRAGPQHAGQSADQPERESLAAHGGRVARLA